MLLQMMMNAKLLSSVPSYLMIDEHFIIAIFFFSNQIQIQIPFDRYRLSSIAQQINCYAHVLKRNLLCVTISDVIACANVYAVSEHKLQLLIKLPLRFARIYKYKIENAQ